MPSDARLRLGLWLSAVCFFAIFSKEIKAAADPTTAPAVSDNDFDTILEKAKAAEGAERDQLLLSIASRFQSVDVCTTAGRNMWSIRTLNERGKGIDGLRFTVPDGMNTHLFWAFSIANLKEWYIIGLNGKIPGFEDFMPGLRYRLPVVFNQHLILQDLPTRLTAGEDYLLWFKVDGDQPVQAYMSIVLLDEDGNATQQMIESAIGLKKQLQKKAKP